MKLLAAFLAFALCVLAWLMLDPGGDEALEAEPAVATTAAPADHEPAPAVATREVERAAVGATPTVDTAEPEPAGEASEAPPTRVLRGIVTDGEDGPALPDLPLEVIEARLPRATLATVVTDALGRFETPALPCLDIFLRHAPDLEALEPAAQLWIQPANVALTPSEDGAPLEREFWASRPGEVVIVDVVNDDGSPASGARVHMPYVATNPETDSLFRTAGGARANSRGRASVGLWDSAGFKEGAVFARGTDDAVSDILELTQEDYLGPHRVRLGPGCELEVQVRWPLGDPVADAEVRVIGGPRDSGEAGDEERFQAVTDESGVCGFSGLYPADYSVWVRNARTHSVDAAPVTLRRGGGNVVEIELELEGRQLAASGSVLDEAGEPLAGVELRFRADERWAEQAVTDKAGHFECWTPPSGSIQIWLDADPHGDVYEPGSRSVAFGSRDVVFRRTARAEVRRFQLRVTDRTTGAEVEPVFLTFDRGAGREEWSNTYAPREAYEIPSSPTTRCKVASEGYVATRFPLFEALEAAAGDPPRIEVELDRGLSCEVLVLDAGTRAPLAGASFTTQDLPVVQTGADGIARLEANLWSVWKVELEGYHAEEWDPEDSILFDHGPIYLNAE